VLISRSSPPPEAFPNRAVGRLLQCPDTDFRRETFTTLQGSLDATARMVASLPGSVRPNAKRQPPKTFTPELSPKVITHLQSRV
jgi:hypothetical protein